MSASIYSTNKIPTESQLKLVAKLEREFCVVCIDYTYTGVANFINKYTSEPSKYMTSHPEDKTKIVTEDYGGGMNE